MKNKVGPGIFISEDGYNFIRLHSRSACSIRFTIVFQSASQSHKIWSQILAFPVLYRCETWSPTREETTLDIWKKDMCLQLKGTK
jgi:hypothetical protein